MNIYYLYGRDTLDDPMMNMLVQKSSLVSDALDKRRDVDGLYEMKERKRRSVADEVRRICDRDVAEGSPVRFEEIEEEPEEEVEETKNQ